MHLPKSKKVGTEVSEPDSVLQALDFKNLGRLESNKIAEEKSFEDYWVNNTAPFSLRSPCNTSWKQ